MTRSFNHRLVFKIIGQLLLVECLFMLLSALVALIYRESDLWSLLYSAAATAAGGSIGILIGRNAPAHTGVRESYSIVAIVWIIFSLFGMLPFLIDERIASPIDAFFETMSGFTTTGATILTNIDSIPHGLLFWRSVMQWLGGMGIIVLSLAMLSQMDSGMKLYMAEVPGPTYDRLQPRIRNTARQLWILYTVLTAIEAVILKLGGMSLFDAVCHALTTLSSGGYSTKQASIAYWDSAFIQYSIIIFMLIAGTNFSLLYWAMIRHRFDKLWRDEEWRAYLFIIALLTLLTTLGLTFYNGVHSLSDFEHTFRDSLFQVVSIITSTGYCTTDYMQWKPVVWALLLLPMFCGGSAGSTSGGLKIIRMHTIAKNSHCEFRRLLNPKAILPVRINGHVVHENTINSIYAFTSIYIVLIAAGTMVIALSGVPLREAFGVSLSSISNIGPGLGVFGPAGTFASLNAFAKIVCAALMLIGRLELFTMLVIFSPTFWRK